MDTIHKLPHCVRFVQKAFLTNNYGFDTTMLFVFLFFFCSIDEISSVVESVVHNTLLNVFIEANSDEFTIDRPLCAITKSILSS